MGFMEKMVRQCRKPTGLLGRFVGVGMNIGHKKIWNWGLRYVSINPDATILDVGCGGGRTVKLLAGLAPHGKAYGIDYSKDMVRLAQNG